VTVLGEMVAGGIVRSRARAEVAARLQPWIDMVEGKLRELFAGSLLESLVPHATWRSRSSRCTWGLTLLSHLDGDHARAESLLDLGVRYAPLSAVLLPSQQTEGRPMSHDSGLDVVRAPRRVTTPVWTWSRARSATPGPGSPSGCWDSGRARENAHLPSHRPHPLQSRVEATAYSFDDPVALARSLEGVTTVYNTYWVRFDRGATTFANATANSQTLFHAARRGRVSASFTSASPTPRSSHAALLSRQGPRRTDAGRSSVPYSIVRPTWISVGSRRPGQQHRVDPAPDADLRASGKRALPVQPCTWTTWPESANRPATQGRPHSRRRRTGDGGLRRARPDDPSRSRSSRSDPASPARRDVSGGASVGLSWGT